MSENSLTIFTRAAAMLAEADTIQKAKELKSLALTAADWARRKGLGEEAISYARSYALEAERKMGEMLQATERAKAGRPSKSVTPSNQLSEPPTLASLGLTKRDSAEAQSLAELPREEFERVKSGKQTRAGIRRAKKDRARKSAKIVCHAVEGVRKGDFRKVLADVHGINAIITDPPYGKHAVELWQRLGVFASERLADDGVLIAYSGQFYLPEVLQVLSQSLDYFWLMAVVHHGRGNLTPLGHPVRKVINQWKPLVFFCKRGCGFDRTFRDLVPNAPPDKTKHNWAQPLDEAKWLLASFTDPGDLVCDPFAGSGTVGVAAKETGRKFIGAEVLE